METKRIKLKSPVKDARKGTPEARIRRLAESTAEGVNELIPDVQELIRAKKLDRQYGKYLNMLTQDLAMIK